MSIPDVFQFRDRDHPGFTHTCKRNAYGDYEVKWARGWFEMKRIYDPWKVADKSEVEQWVSEGGWIIVDEQKAEKEAAKATVKEALPDSSVSTKLPDVFHFVLTDSIDATVFKATKGEHNYLVSWTEPGGETGQTTYPLEMVQGIVRDKIWTIVDEPLPDVFYFRHSIYSKDVLYKATWNGDVFDITWKGQPFDCSYPRRFAEQFIEGGEWLRAAPLTAEQIRLNKELNEQILALQSSVRISEQAEEHQKRLQASYKERIDVLKAKLVEGV